MAPRTNKRKQPQAPVPPPDDLDESEVVNHDNAADPPATASPDVLQLHVRISCCEESVSHIERDTYNTKMSLEDLQTKILEQPLSATYDEHEHGLEVGGKEGGCVGQVVRRDSVIRGLQANQCSDAALLKLFMEFSSLKYQNALEGGAPSANANQLTHTTDDRGESVVALRINQRPRINMENMQQLLSNMKRLSQVPATLLSSAHDREYAHINDKVYSHFKWMEEMVRDISDGDCQRITNDFLQLLLYRKISPADFPNWGYNDYMTLVLALLKETSRLRTDMGKIQIRMDALEARNRPSLQPNSVAARTFPPQQTAINTLPSPTLNAHSSSSFNNSTRPSTSLQHLPRQKPDHCINCARLGLRDSTHETFDCFRECRLRCDENRCQGAFHFRRLCPYYQERMRARLPTQPPPLATQGLQTHQ